MRRYCIYGLVPHDSLARKAVFWLDILIEKRCAWGTVEGLNIMASGPCASPSHRRSPGRYNAARKPLGTAKTP